MKRSAAILALAALLALTGCQETPDTEFVIGKDTDRMVEMAQASAAPAPAGTDAADGAQEPLHAARTVTGADGLLTIRLDAELALPEGPVSIVRAAPALYTEAQARALFDLFFPDERPYQTAMQVETKETLEQAIRDLQRRYADGEYAGTQQEYEAELAALQQAFAAAPDGQPADGRSDGSPVYTYGGEAMEYGVYDDRYEFQLFSVTTRTPAQLMTGSSARFRLSAPRSYSLRSPVRLGADGAGVPEEAAAALTVSFDEARALCEQVIAAAGEDPAQFAVSEAFVLDDEDINGQTHGNFAYHLRFARLVGGVPSIVGTDESGAIVNAVQAGDEGGAAIPWSYESIQFTVDNGGLVSAKWSDPAAVGETVVADAALRPLAEILDIFETMMKARYEGMVRTLFEGRIRTEIVIERAQLCMVRVREQNTAAQEQAGLYVPAWVFYGFDRGQNDAGDTRYSVTSISDLSASGGGIAAEGGVDVSVDGQFAACPAEQPAYERIYLVINAVDGSVIDLAKGY